ncbi:dihydrodipicolinate synthase family protein [Elongatibacter sediminis]|uniref:Dihydrodipicolinate synthase family protein n=1 Tax=Elongatibacter sediminis TaxID=3119006 RepID=A0AAW9RCJ5_9GAMM
MEVAWQGVMPALMTEMNRDESLDLDATARHIEVCLEQGVAGFVMLGTLGENSSLLPHEKEAVLRQAVETVNGRVPVLSGVAEYTTDLAVEHCDRAAKAGCDGLMVLPCMVYEQDSREAIQHFATVAGATDLPIMIYNNPLAYKVDLSPEDFQELAQYESIVAVKESSHDSRRMTDMINACGDRYRLFCGVDDLALENLLFGASGWVSGMANTFPRESVALFEKASQGRVDEAVDIYRWFMPSLHLDVAVKLVQYIKLANQLAGTGSEWVRRPRLTLEGAERRMVEQTIESTIKSRPRL